MGNDVVLEGGQLRATGGRVELGGLVSPGSIGLNINGGQRSLLSFPSDVTRADVYLTNNGSNPAVVDVAASNGGSIAITARNIDIVGGSLLRGGLETGLGFPSAEAEDISLSAQEAINIANGSILTFVGPGSVGNGGDIDITAGSLSVTNGSILASSTLGQGNAGRVNIDARNTVSFDGPSGASSSVEAGGVGNGGGISITARSLSVTNGAVLVTSTFKEGEGNAGSVTINARDTISFDGVRSSGRPSAVFSIVDEEAVGNSGSINITARSLSVTNGAELFASTSGQGNAGSLTINTRDTVSFDGPSGVSSTVELGAIGNGGDIDITAESLSMTNGAQLGASTYEKGDAGNVTINASDTISFDGVRSSGLPSAAFSTVELGAIGNGGDIDITAGSLSVTNGAGLVASTRGQGDAGNVTINASDTISFDGVRSSGLPSAAFSTVELGAMGSGGDIDITTGSLFLINGAQVSASSRGSGTAGNIDIKASSVRLDKQAFLSSETIAGQGNINLSSQDLILRSGSNISTDATGTATGGNINIDTDLLVALENSDIRANAQEASGGQVQINAQGIFGTQFREAETLESDITASSEFGVSGVVELNTPDVDPSQGVVALPEEVVDVSGLVAQRCPAGGGTVASRSSKFVVTGRGGLPPSPTDPASSDTGLANWITLDPKMEPRSDLAPAENPTSSSEATPIVEAQRWERDSKGQVILTAQAANVTPRSPGLMNPSCRKF